MTTRHTTSYVLAFLLYVVPLTASASTIVIDDFSSPTGTNSRAFSDTGNSFATTSTTVTGATGALGGQRTLQAATQSGGASTDLTDVAWNGITGNPDVDILIRADTGNTYTGVGTVAWGATTPLNQDFTTAGSPLLFILTLEDIVAPGGTTPSLAQVNLSFTTQGGGSANHTLSLLTGGSLSSQYVWQESDFVGYSFSDVDEITLTFTVGYNGTQTNTSDTTVSLSSLVAVPEPSTYAMLLAGLGCGAAGIIRRRRRGVSTR